MPGAYSRVWVSQVTPGTGEFGREPDHSSGLSASPKTLWRGLCLWLNQQENSGLKSGLMVSQENVQNEEGGKKNAMFHAAVLSTCDSRFIIQVDDPWPPLLIRVMCAEGGNEAVSY